MAKVIELSYKGYPIYKGDIVSGEFNYKSPECIPQEEWNEAICDLISRFDKFLKNGRNHPVPPPPVVKVAYAHATF